MRLLAACVVAAMGLISPVCGQQVGGSIDVPAGARVVLTARGDGVQIYGCVSGGSGFQWKLEGPDAKLLDASGAQIGKHFAGPTWELNDGSRVEGVLAASQPSPDAKSVAWLLLRAKPGTATGQLAEVGLIRRTETHGGVPAAPACESASDAGKTARVPYTATYTFYAEK